MKSMELEYIYIYNIENIVIWNIWYPKIYFGG